MTAHVANILDRLFSHVPNFKVAKSTVQYMAPSSSRSRCPGNSWWSCIATFRCSFSPVRILLNRDFPLYLQEKFPGLHTTSQRFSGTITGKISRSPYYFTEIFWYNYRKKFPGLYTPKLRFSVRITVIKSCSCTETISFPERLIFALFNFFRKITSTFRFFSLMAI